MVGKENEYRLYDFVVAEREESDLAHNWQVQAVAWKASWEIDMACRLFASR